MSEADDLLRKFKGMVGDAYGAVKGPEAKQQARMVMEVGPAFAQALLDAGMFLVGEGEGVVDGKVVKLRVRAKDAL